MAYQLGKRIGIVFLCIYFIVGMTDAYVDLKPIGINGEAYPFYTWQLFSHIPNEQSEYTIQFLEIGNTRYKPPLSFAQSENMFIEQGISPPEFIEPINRLGEGARYEQADQIAEFEAEIATLFSEGPYHYQILSVTYDPVEYWRTGTFDTVAIVHEVQSK